MGSVPRSSCNCPSALGPTAHRPPLVTMGRCWGGRCWAHCPCLVITVVFIGPDGDKNKARAISGVTMECSAVRTLPLLPGDGAGRRQAGAGAQGPS